MKKVLSLLIAALFVFTGCAGAATSEESSQNGSLPAFSEEIFVGELRLATTEELAGSHRGLEDAQNWYQYVGDDPTFYAVKKDGTGRTALVEPTEGEYYSKFYLYNEWIYYTVTDNADMGEKGAFGIRRVSTDGQTREVILTDSDWTAAGGDGMGKVFHYLAVAEDSLFIGTHYELYVYVINTGALGRLGADARTAQLTGDKLYFLNGYSIYSYDISVGETTLLLEANREEKADVYKCFAVIGNDLYYSKRNPDGLYHYKDGVSTLISDDPDLLLEDFSAYDGKLFIEKSVGEGGTVTMCYDSGC